MYHQRWRIEEAFKRLKQRLKLECISGLTQQALLVDVAAKVLADNLAALVCMAAQTAQQLQPDERVCNRAYAAHVMQRWLARALLAIQDIQGLIADAIALLGKNLVRRVAGRSQPRPRRHVKPHLQGVDRLKFGGLGVEPCSRWFHLPFGVYSPIH